MNAGLTQGSRCVGVEVYLSSTGQSTSRRFEEHLSKHLTELSLELLTGHGRSGLWLRGRAVEIGIQFPRCLESKIGVITHPVCLVALPVPVGRVNRSSGRPRAGISCY
jgi:hypothetical protein